MTSSLSVTTTAATPVGTYTFHVRATDGTGCQDNNTTDSGQVLTLTVTKADQTISFGALGNKTFGDAPFTVSATGGGSGNPVIFTASGTCTSGSTNGATITITGAGSCTVNANQAGNGSYNAAPQVQQSFTIAKASSTTVVSCPTSVTYDGTAKTPCTATVTGAGGLSQSPAAGYSANTNAGTVTASASFAGDPNHTASSDSKTFTINQASWSTVVSCPASVTYTGTAKTPVHGHRDGRRRAQPAGDRRLPANTNAGTATASATLRRRYEPHRQHGLQDVHDRQAVLGLGDLPGQDVLRLRA